MAMIENQHNTMMGNIEKYKCTLFMHTSPAHKQPKKRYKKSEAIKILERMEAEHDATKHPTIDKRYLAPRLHSDKTANGLTKAITRYITLRGGMASRINTTGIWDQKLSKYRPTTMKRGLADIWATYQGKSLQIEVKIGADRQSEDQIKVQQQQEEAGGLYFVAKDFSSFKHWFDQL